MTEAQYQHTVDGQEMQEEDINLVALEAARADDKVFAELLRLTPFAGTVAKTILPYGTAQAASGTTAGTVQTSGIANSGVIVYPFRAVLGSRDTIANIGADANWRDLRSITYNVSDNGTTYGHLVNTFAANASGNPRWDLVYAAFTVDANGLTATRYEKPANGGALVAASLVTTLVQSIAIAIVTGTPAATPTQPAAPADSGGVYYFPLAYVRIPNGFGGANTIDSRDIYEVIPVTPSLDIGGSMVADQSVAVGGSVNSSTNFKWTGTTAVRPPVSLPPSLQWDGPLIFEMDLGGISTANSHGSGAAPPLNIIDASRDWRKRFFKVHVACVATGGAGFAQDRASGASAGNRIPAGGAAVNALFWQFGQSFTADAAAIATHSIAAGSSAVASLTSTQLAPMRAGSYLLIYVDGVTGALACDYDTTGPQSKFMFWIEATTPMADY